MICPLIYELLSYKDQLFGNMRHTIAFTGSNRIKNGQLSFNIQSLQDGEYVKVSEGPKHIYMVYRLSEQMNMREAVLNEKLLTLNGLNQSGKCVV